MTEMRAVGFTEFGDPSVLGIVMVPKPSPGPGEVLVKVAAATVNPTDLGFRLGGRALPPGVEPPYIPGMDLAGVVDAAGPSVAAWQAGDQVMAAVSQWEPGGGAQAEYRVVAEDQLAKVPADWPLTDAATLPMNGLTVRAALDMLALPAGLDPGRHRVERDRRAVRDPARQARRPDRDRGRQARGRRADRVVRRAARRSAG